jgi:hypothetical protein
MNSHRWCRPGPGTRVEGLRGSQNISDSLGRPSSRSQRRSITSHGSSNPSSSRRIPVLSRMKLEATSEIVRTGEVAPDVLPGETTDRRQNRLNSR